MCSHGVSAYDEIPDHWLATRFISWFCTPDLDDCIVEDVVVYL